MAIVVASLLAFGFGALFMTLLVAACADLIDLPKSPGAER